MTNSILAGAAITTITPPVGIQMMGFGARDHGAEGIHDDLHAKALWLRQGDTDIVFISVEVSAFSVADANRIKAMLTEQYGVPPGQVLINNTHTHAGPLVAPRLYPMGGAPDPTYVEQVLQAVVAVAGSAREALQPADLAVGLGDCQAGIGRRLPTPDGIIMAPNPDEPINTDSMVLSVTDADGAPLAILFSISCHPTVMGASNYQISAEFPGAACGLLEARYPGATAIFLQGATGELKARQVADPETGRFRSGTFADVEAVGATVANDITTLLDGELVPVQGSLRGASTFIPLPLNKFDDPRSLYESVLAGETTTFRPHWATYHLQQLEAGHAQPDTIDCPVQMIRLGESLSIFAYGGELCSLHADHVKAAIDGAVFTMGYSNGMMGYLPTDQMLDEGGYEPMASISGSPELHAPLAHGIDQRLLEAAQRLAEQAEVK